MKDITAEDAERDTRASVAARGGGGQGQQAPARTHPSSLGALRCVAVSWVRPWAWPALARRRISPDFS